MIRLCIALDDGRPCNEEVATPLGCCDRHASQRHETWSRYVRGCRCIPCTRAAAEYQRQRKAEAKADPVVGHDWTWDRIAEVYAEQDRQRMEWLNATLGKASAA